jgi:2-polyprenyl-6-methoxyphenol hydroxylase-like FAD-dependent oxidoreductase
MNEEPEEPAQVVIVGAGIVGLVLALALHKHCGIKVELYEQAQAFHDDVGAGMGMYPNGLRVIRDISPQLLEQIKEQGYPYLFRRWEVRREY